MTTKHLRRYLGDTLFSFKARLGSYRLKSNGGSIAVLMYHGLQSDPAKRLACPLDVDPDHCLNELLFFQKQGYRIVAPHELKTLPASGNYLVITFDDGHLNILQHLKSWMEEYRIPFTLAVCPDLVEHQSIFWWEEVAARLDLSENRQLRLSTDETSFDSVTLPEFLKLACEVPNAQRLDFMRQLQDQTRDISEQQVRAHDAVHTNMDWAQLNELASNPLCSLASHSPAHEVATSLQTTELIQNAENSRRIIELKTGRYVSDYVYPNGICNQSTDAAIRKAGYERCFSLGESLNPAGLSSGNLSRFRGYGFGSENLRYYGHLWQQRHARSNRLTSAY